eukprot:g12718.t1
MEDVDLSVREEDVAALCKMEIWTVKKMIRPDTFRIATSFDKMMDAVKFARRLSVLSMEWSGNFSKEEYLALAQDLSEEDTPGVITLESFMSAAKSGAVNLPPCWRKIGSETRIRSIGRDALQAGDHGCRVDEFVDEGGDRRGSGASARDANGIVTVNEDTLETTLQQAAAKARMNGQDVWKLLDACIQGSLEEARAGEDDHSPTSDDVAAQTYLGPEVAQQFLAKLDVRIVRPLTLPSPSPRRQADDTMGKEQQQQRRRQQQQQQQPDVQAADARSPRHGPHRKSPSSERREEGVGERAAASSFLSVRNALEARSRGSREGSPARNASATPSSASPQFSSAREAFESKKTSIQDEQSAKREASAPSSHPSQEAPSACDRYLRALSRDTASVRCRVQFYQQELARTLREAESLVSRAAINLNNGDSFQGPSRPLPPDVDSSVATRRGLGGSGGGDRSVAAEIGGGIAAATGSGGGGAAGMSLTGPIVGFSRVSPVGRADPSHPRMELASRPGSSTPHGPSPSSRTSGHAQDPGRGIESAPKESGGSGPGGQRASDGRVSQRNGGGDGPKVAVSERVAKLLLAALDDTKANAPPPSAASPAAAAAAAVARKKIAAAPKTACFDPPSVRNGLAGLTPNDVDNVLLRVEAATPGAVSSWMSPVGSGRRRTRTGGTELLTPSTLGRGLATEARARRRRSANLSADSIGWFDAEGSAKGILQQVGAQGSAGGRPGARRKKGGGGARRKRSILKIRLPPRTPRSPPKESGGEKSAIQAAPAVNRRQGSWGIEHVEWATSSVDDEEGDDDAEDFTGNNPMYGRPVETIDEKNIQTRTLPARPKRSFSFAPRKKGGGGGGGGGPFASSDTYRSRRSHQVEGPSSVSPSVSAGRSSADEGYPYDSNASATYARFTRRPVRAFQKLDEDVYDEFLNCTKKKPKSGRVVRRMGTLG